MIEDPDTIPELDEEMAYETCRVCGGDSAGCTNCWDAGVVPHTACEPDGDPVFFEDTEF